MLGKVLLGRSILGQADKSLPQKVVFSCKSNYQVRLASPKFSRIVGYSITYGLHKELESRYKIDSGLLSKLASSYGIVAYSKQTLTSKYDVGGKVVFPLNSEYGINLSNKHNLVSRYSITKLFVKSMISSYTIIGSLLLVTQSNRYFVKDRNRTIRVKR